MQKPIVIFGAGKFGKLALNKYKDCVAYFIDNNNNLWGEKIGDKIIRPLEYFLNDGKEKYTLLIACKSQAEIKKQLESVGISEYECYLETEQSYNPTDELIYNPYENERNRNLSEEKYNELTKNSYKASVIKSEMENLHGKELLFTHIEIETVNRCNGYCDFCPVSKNNDIREYCEMTDQLFEKIILELKYLNYSGKLALFSNNEPLLDPKIVERHRFARENLPNARMHLFTNGTLLSVETFVELMKYLDELIIDNYQQELRLIKPCEKIVEYCEHHPELKKRVTIVLRKPHEILSSRGGDAPNRKQKVSIGEVQCILPFKQMIIRPDGKVSLCCNDPYGRNTLGDVSVNTLSEIWNNDRFKTVRDCLYIGRKEWKHCEYCDFMSLG